MAIGKLIGKLTNDSEASASILPVGLTKQMRKPNQEKKINIGKTSFTNIKPKKRWSK
jgi:hypothetical protein